ncbi:MAG: FAD-dependent oxidoreductase [Saprospiraceae bacterium]|nr:FAD-dependent oxidoreductase [Saprospiraceae bacterium]
MEVADRVIIGAGIFGLYFALECAKRNQSVVVLEYEDEAFTRASYVNQSRIHNGYHYPRSLATAAKTASYFDRFVHDFEFCIRAPYKNIYATSDHFSWVNSAQFYKFCQSLKLPVREIDPGLYLQEGKCDGAFETMEYSFDTLKLKSYFLEQLGKFTNCRILYGCRIDTIQKSHPDYLIEMASGIKISTGFVLNASYASLNQVLKLADLPSFDVKYELCEIILCQVSPTLREVGITLMDGPFFSLIPFGQSQFHALSSVAYTPHKASNTTLPEFDCQPGTNCSPIQLQNCNQCPNKPTTHWPAMHQHVKKYLRADFDLAYVSSLFAVKAILQGAEMDDARPTVIQKHSDTPNFYSVLSGKINTIYDLDELI